MISEVEIFPAFVPPNQLQGRKYQALYDTGATHSSISPRVVADLKLASIGAQNVHVGGGTLPTTAHLVNIGLPNKVMFTMMRVAQVALHGEIDALIGMDILGVGDFTVTHHNGNTTFSFCCPSRREIDFVAEVQAGSKIPQAHSNKVGRNGPCPCGSGKKYKKCCGVPNQFGSTTQI
ncbi:MAG TPA: aspartyl protease family protein [Bryobacteraceae bacterium]|nr:aspartyl protease family protein [Bryobacteraceae bacterium]